MGKVTLWLARLIVGVLGLFPAVVAMAISLAFMTVERIQRQKAG